MNRKPTSPQLLNYTTKIEPTQTAGEIMGLLAAKGAQSINLDYKNGEPVALWFKIDIGQTQIGYRLPCNYEGALRRLKRSAPPRYHSLEQAKRVAWRIVKDWIVAQLALVECEQAEMGEVFLPYAVTGSNKTLFQVFKENTNRLLNPGTEPEEEEDNVVAGRFRAID